MAQHLPDRQLPQQLLQAREALMGHFRPILHHYGLSEQQWRILRALDEQAPREPHALCAQCQILSSSMAGILARMEQSALVARSRVDTDARRVLVDLAPRGHALVAEMAPLIERQYQYLEQACGKDALDALSSALGGFIAAASAPVRRVALPARALAGRP